MRIGVFEHTGSKSKPKIGARQSFPPRLLPRTHHRTVDFFHLNPWPS